MTIRKENIKLFIPKDIGNNEVHVFCSRINSQLYKYNLSSCKIFDENEKLIINQLCFEEDKIAFIYSRYLLKTILGSYYSIHPIRLIFLKTSTGKLELVLPKIQSPLTFSLSRSGNFVCCAVSKNNSIGVDIEKFRLIDDEINFAKNILTQKEKEEIFKSINSVQTSYEIINLWTLKEAFSKAIGLGLSLSFKQIGFNRTGKNREGIIFTIPDNFNNHDNNWSFALFDLGQNDYALSIASETKKNSATKIIVYVIANEAEYSHTSIKLISKSNKVSTTINFLPNLYV